MPAALFAKSMKNGRHSERPPTSVDAVAQTITVFYSFRAQSSVTTSAWLFGSLSRSTTCELVSPLRNFHADASHRYDHLQKLDFSRPKLESASAPSRGWNAWNSAAAGQKADGRKPSYQNSFCCAFVRTGRSAALPCQGQIIPVQWSRLSGEGNCPKADNHPRASEGGSEGAIEGRTDGGNNNGRFRSLSVRWMDRGSCQAIIDERRETWRPTVCRTIGEEGNGAAVLNIGSSE